MCLVDKKSAYALEKSLCMLRPEVWLHEAYNIFYSADVLSSFEVIKNTHLWQHDAIFSGMFGPELTNLGSFNWRVQRMLLAYGFENVLKCIILIEYRATHPDIYEVPLLEIKSHNLIWLSGKAGFNLTEEQAFYLKILEKCAVWAGRYPLPVNEEHMYEQREALPSSNALSARSHELHEKHMRGEIPRAFTESDVLHSAIGTGESQVYSALREKMMNKADALLRSSKVTQNSHPTGG